MNPRATPAAPSALPPRTAVRLHVAVLLGSALFGILACDSPGAGAASPAPVAATGVVLETVVSGLDSPLYVTSPPGDARLFVVEQPGRIRIIENGQRVQASFLDISDRIKSGGEQGLLGLAFHPSYATNHLFYVNYTNLSGDTRVERYRTTSDPNVADPASGQLVLAVDQPFENHNGGHILFGTDGKLYIGMGDGGSGGDPRGHGQNLATLLGKMLRIDVDGAEPYIVPPDNPFVGQKGKAGEIWAYGLRNPWRFCFDRTAGMLYIADVGQNEWEEIDVQTAGSKGLDYGWAAMEGSRCYQKQCDPAGRVLPAVEYNHGQGCSITGGFVYRGSKMTAVIGHYFYGDYCSGWIRSFKYGTGKVTEHREWRNVHVAQLSSFGEDAAGELYACSLGGTVYRLAWKTPPAPARR